MQTPSASPPPEAAGLAIVTPVFNDWGCLARLVRELDRVAAGLPRPVTVVVVDDGSIGPAPATLADPPPAHLAALRLVTLRCNLGHQRALAIGLAECADDPAAAQVVVMDSDGEDSPDDIPRLLAAAASETGAIVVARRARRSESTGFRIGYQLYRLGFMALTGRTIDFGNYCLLPAAAVRRLVFMPECWNHLAAAVVKSRLPLVRVDTLRGTRWAGASSMNLVALVVHGFSAISVFIETVITRVLFFFGATLLAAAALALAAVGVRLFTGLAIPGWATTVLGMAAMLFLQSLTVMMVMLFSVLSTRSAVPFVAGAQASVFVARRDTLFPSRPHADR